MNEVHTEQVRPLIGLPGRRIKGRDIGYPDILHDLDLNLYFADYSRAVIAAGGIPLLLPLDLDPALVIDRLDGVLLSGGADVDPARFGAERDPEVKVVEPERDEFEFALLEGAIEADVPVLGICRGLQVLNVVRGGTLHQHIPEHSRYDVSCDTEVHEVSFTEGSALADLYGPTHQTNSLHHQTVDQVGDGLTITGRDAEGTVEGLELNDRVIAVQWHPEMMAERDVDPIFTWLVNRASAVATA